MNEYKFIWSETTKATPIPIPIPQINELHMLTIDSIVNI